MNRDSANESYISDSKGRVARLGRNLFCKSLLCEGATPISYTEIFAMTIGASYLICLREDPFDPGLRDGCAAKELFVLASNIAAQPGLGDENRACLITLFWTYFCEIFSVKEQVVGSSTPEPWRNLRNRVFDFAHRLRLQGPEQSSSVGVRNQVFSV